MVGLLRNPLHGEKQYLDDGRHAQRRSGGTESLNVMLTTEETSNQAVGEPVRAIR